MMADHGELLALMEKAIKKIPKLSEGRPVVRIHPDSPVHPAARDLRRELGRTPSLYECVARVRRDHGYMPIGCE